ncbi:acyclic terpene utilization AtuA family protein [Roseitranquillus sediminis]|uniref:acyclic terpene utilization AtuA family protein n=1 Tax=Roseitranquillus sediminis TaxID=2809051 RepID=UPI001D0CA20B|nr:acyclic terpene utilization AtuA family protein [Roseitranquillus sediminis]MBM9593881.1 acyclic terpene utilization AtuA family protein [Roseitranquillus sediminis]
MPEIRVLSASGQIGSGFLESSIERGFSLKPHVIACDGGSTDAGPAHLGSGKPHFSREGTKRDLRLMLKGRDRLGVPLVIGSCGMAGGDAGLAWMRDIALEIAREEGLNFRLALVSSEQDKDYLKQKLRDGKIHPLDPAPSIDEDAIDRSAHVVGMMGHEPIAAAVADGADVVLAGRASDTALFAAVPLMQGAGPGPAWHAAKILECGTAATVQRKRPDSIFAWIRDDHFDIEPMDMECRCTPQSIASHTLYENADPFLIREPGGTLDTRNSTYEALDDRRVRVRGSEFLPADRLTIKLEGAELAGYQTIIVAGVREPYILRQLDTWLTEMRERFAVRVEEMFPGTLGPDEYSIHARVYGRDGVMGKLEPRRDELGHEVGLLFTVTAPTQAIANSIGKTFAHFALHYPIPEWRGLISGLAFPMSPPEVDRGEVYRFHLNHVVEPDDPGEMFRTEMREVAHA